MENYNFSLESPVSQNSNLELDCSGCIATLGHCACESSQVLLSLGERFLPQLHTPMGVAQTAGLSPCIFMSTHYQEEAGVGLLGVKLSGG